MWWYVKWMTRSEIHVYPLAEEAVHVLRATLCSCLPEVRHAGGIRMIVHKRMGQAPTHAPLKPAFKAHWIR